MLEWIAVSFSRGSSQPRARTQVSAPNIRTVWISLVAQIVKNLSAVHKTRFSPWVEKGMATYSTVLVWRIPWTEEPGRLQSMGFQRVGHD